MLGLTQRRSLALILALTRRLKLELSWRDRLILTLELWLMWRQWLMLPLGDSLALILEPQLMLPCNQLLGLRGRLTACWLMALTVLSCPRLGQLWRMLLLLMVSPSAPREMPTYDQYLTF
jgi:hypothetical protein